VQNAHERKCEPIAFTSKAPKLILNAVKSPETQSLSSMDSSVSLADLRRGEAGIVSGLTAATGLDANEGTGEMLLARLRDLGFVAGAHCEIIARMWPKGDPMAVRIGGSTFALRRAEAAAVRIIRVTKPALAESHAALA
jgi:ferrous iron transport protein A